ncbi:zincin-like metallopeptidase domain-containing protein [Bradyrhizobium sp. AUGA SZCCT0160]|uniref:zincin-like metallopeptidase domain-containing protein n=1 Tax=Bradyrhizobium sp. AUGA SZCCT0160 TaxID=2807662 RepID=UPI001BA7EF56|nr:zincin-like metallopeptidase domain-containing protein [Bradyrhizobium sp. AUGA SZCCT0160]MBR1187350.1 hypothetical protein [Bradyrhizobium sp. AUGA SZCCT0160]
MPADEVRALTFFSLVLVIVSLIFVNRSFTTSMVDAFLDEPSEGLAPVIIEKLEAVLRDVKASGIPVLSSTAADIQHGGARAFYSPSRDVICVPHIEAFQDAESYYAVLIHELTHWTRHKSRLDRDLGRKRHGDAGYEMEELVAELGAAFILADLDLTPQVREEHAAYIEGWFKVLKSDKRAIFTAASHAQRAADYLQGLLAPITAVTAAA